MVFFVDSQEDLVLVSILLIWARRCSIVFIIDFEQLFAYRVIFALFDSVDQFRANFPFLYPLKTTGWKLWLYGVFMGYRNGILTWNRLNKKVFPVFDLHIPTKELYTKTSGSH